MRVTIIAGATIAAALIFAHYRLRPTSAAPPITPALCAGPGFKCPGRFFNYPLKGWTTNQPVYYAFETDNSVVRAMGTQAFNSWNNTTRRNRTGITFTPADLTHPAQLIVRTGPLGDTGAGLIDNTAHYARSGTLASARITVDLAKFNLTYPGYHDAIYKTMLHEVGHSMNLSHPCNPVPRESVMYPRMIGINDTGSTDLEHPPNYPNMDGGTPMAPTEDCDMIYSAVFNDVFVTDFPESPRRPKPPNMPAESCQPCMITVEMPEGPPRREPGFCCGANADNGPREPNEPPSFAFISTGYECRMDGWIQFRCSADMCCMHPDDVPEGALQLHTGTTCAAQAWWESNDRAGCERAINGDPDGRLCEKKEMCGAGVCMPWPHYCWKIPNVPHQTPQPTPDPNSGVQCSAKGWYNGDDKGHDDCFADHPQGCEKKQDCDGQQCLPFPFYCWMPK